MPTWIHPHDGIKIFSATISHQPLGLAIHRPEHWARPTRCFENVLGKVGRDGGATRFGWTFHYRIAPGTGGYLFVIHHAVWHAPDGRLVDVTPFHDDPKHHPITEGNGVLFLVDDAARPVETENLIAPLPMRYFPLSDDERLVSYVGKLNHEEQLKCQEIYEGRI